MTIHLAPSGDDQEADGSPGRPFRTLTAAVLASRKAKAPSRKIIVAEGVYLNTSATLTHLDSGLTIAAAEGATPVFHAGQLVTDWREEDGLWVADLPGVASGEWDFRTLLVDGCPAPRARFPREGVLHHQSRFEATWVSSTAGGWDVEPTKEERTTMRVRADDLPQGIEAANAEVRVYHQWDESLVSVAAIDRAKGMLTFADWCEHPPGAFANNPKRDWYVLFNIRAGLTDPGQWMLDRVAGQLLYWPLPGQRPETTEVIAPNAPSILTLFGTKDAPIEDVKLTGLTFTATTPLRKAGFGGMQLPGAIEASGVVVGLALNEVTFRGCGGTGLRVRTDKADKPDRVKVQRCTFKRLGGPALVVTADKSLVADCTITDVGRDYPSSIALRCDGADTRIEHNTISGCPYSAIAGIGPRSTVRANRIRDFMRELDDGAAIYIFAGKEVILSENVTTGTSGRMAHAYYLDEQSEDCTVEKNLAVDVAWPIHNHMARNCTIRDNLFVDAGTSKLTFMRCKGFTFERNIVVAGEGICFHTPRPGLASTSENFFWHGTGPLEVVWTDPEGYAGSDPEPLPLSDGSRVVDPGLVKSADGTFGLAPSGAAALAGLTDKDWSTAGPRSKA